MWGGGCRVRKSDLINWLFVLLMPAQLLGWEMDEEKGILCDGGFGSG